MNGCEQISNCSSLSYSIVSLLIDIDKKSPAQDTQRCALRPSPRRFPLCVPALATCFPRAFRLICARSACCAPSCPPHFRRACPPHFRPCAAPLSRPSLATPPSPSSACSRSSRAYSRSFRVFMCSRIPPRAFAPCFCAASLTPHAPNLAVRAPRAAPREGPVQDS